MAKIPNFITVLRIIGSFFMLAVEPFSISFYIIYTLCGISDVLDGVIARHFKITSESGAVLDSVADLTFYSCLLVRLFPYLYTRTKFYIWFAIAFVILFRLSSYILSAVKFHRLSALHTYANKLTGFAVFSFPFFMLIVNKTLLTLIVCGVSFISTVEELIIHITSPSYPLGRKTVFKRH